MQIILFANFLLINLSFAIGVGSDFYDLSSEVVSNINIGIYIGLCFGYISAAIYHRNKSFKLETSSKKNSEDLIEYKNLLKSTMEATNEGVLQTDANGNIQYSNNAAQHILSNYDIHNLPAEDFCYDDGKTQLHCRDFPILRCLRTASKCTLDVMIGKGDETQLVRFSATPRFDCNHNLIGAISTFESITKSNQSHEKLKIVFNASKTGMLFLSSLGVIKSVNSALLDLVGYRSHELVGKTLSTLISPNDHHLLRSFVSRCFDVDVTDLSVDILGQHKDGKQIHLEITMSKISSCGQSEQLIVINDLTNSIHTEHVLLAKDKIIDTLDQDFHLFGRVASQNIGLSLRKIISYCTIAEKKADSDEEVLNLFENIKSNACSMEQSLEKLIDYCFISDIAYESEGIDLKKILGETINNHENIRDNESLNNAIQILPKVEGSSRYLLQLFSEVFSLCLETSPNDKLLEITLESKVRDNSILEIKIRDNGTGVCTLDSSFSNLQPVAHQKPSKKISATFRLTLCRKILEAMGGSFTSDATPGVGSTYYLNLKKFVDT